MLKLGIKLSLLPIFIASIALSFGFTNETESRFSEQLLIDACFNYLIQLDAEKNNPQQFEFRTGTPPDSWKDIFSFAAPDTTDKPDTTVIRDTLLTDSLKLFDTTKVVLSRADSILFKAKQDSLRRIDSLSQDSTARIQYFKASREDYLAVPFRSRKPSPFFVQPSAASLIRTAELDSTGTKVIIKEKIAGQEAKVYLEIPLEEYIQLRYDALNRDLWEQKGYEYKLKSDKKDLSQLITDITNIDIPLPSTSLLSIFGPPKINLKIAGAVDIHGAWRSETTTGITSSALGNTRNEPDFKQQVQINLSGTIGDKLTISADWNTERQFQYENQLKIKYTGYEDEIIQSIEAGNVTLQASPLIGGSEALFGVKAQMKVGPFSLTALASQKKGEVQEVSVSGGAKAQKFELHAYEYSPNHFFIHSVYADSALNAFNKYYGNPTPVPIDSIRVKDIEVWKSVTGIINPELERKANAYINLPRRSKGELLDELRDSTKETIPGIQEIDRRFIQLQEGIDYEVHEATGFISFKTQIQNQDAIAVAFRMEGPTTSNDDDVYFGEFRQDVVGDSTTRIVLRLVKPPNLQPQFEEAWKLQLRNIYPIGGRAVKKEGFVLDIKYQVEGQEAQSEYNGVKLIQAFGLDRYNESGSPEPDGAFDFDPERTIFTSTGEIIFPVLKPFGSYLPSTPPLDLPSELQYNTVYDTTVAAAKDDGAHDKFIITGEYSASVTSVYNVGFNVVENSVRVLLNEVPLKEGIDYTVDYNLGQVIIRRDEALVPGANLKISYEQNDLFQLASKTLVGLRGLYEFNKQTSLGFSFLNLNQQTLSDKVRIGEEPLNNSIYGVDFKSSFNLPFITKALDKVISTSAPSTLTLNAEYAYINPDPNTKKSTIAGDDNRSIAYIDDFEGAKRIIPLGISYGSWRDISVPDSLPVIGTLPQYNDPQKQQPQDAQMNYKAKAYWFNITPSDVTVEEIYGDRKVAAPDQQQITVLDFVYLPTERGYYNYFPDLDEKEKNWAGIMKPLSSTANNLLEENIEFIEFWVNQVTAPQDLKLYLDLGQISEDIIPNGKLDTEDKNQNDLVDEREDTGIDGIANEEETGYNSETNDDPANDKYDFRLGTGDYSKINGTEGNAVSIDLGRLPDSEDLNRNFTIDKVNSYFRYEVPLDTNKATNPFVQGGGNGWFLYRIPLKDYIRPVGDPSLSVVETIRLWVSGVTENVHLRFAEMNLVGNQWEKVLRKATTDFPEVTIDDEVLTVSTINYEDNPEYIIPPGVQRERDRTKPDYEIFKNEQSLNLILQNLDDGDKREVVRNLYKPLDVFNYKEMKLYYHADDSELQTSISYYNDSSDYATQVYLRFGADTTNYYEYRLPLQKNLEQQNWSEIKLVFSELTAIKQARDTALSVIKNLYLVPIEGKKGHTYGVRGNPTLTRISFFMIGIINPKGIGNPNDRVSGSLWVNELRVLEADATPGWAYTASGSLALADLLKLNFSISQTNPYFHKLSDRFGSRDDKMSWSASADLDVLKLLPVNLPGSNLRIAYNRQESSIDPLYQPGTDIKVSEAQDILRRSLNENNPDSLNINKAVEEIKTITQTKTYSETWTLSNIKIKIPTDAWYIRDTFNNLTFSFNYNKTSSRSPTIYNSNSWTWNAGASYSVVFSRELYFKPVDIPLLGDLLSIFTDYKDVKIYFAPQTITANVTAVRKRNYSLTRSKNLTTKPNIQRDFTSQRGAGFTWALTEGGLLNLSLNYDFDIQSSLAYLLAIDNIDRSESEIWNDIFSGNFFGNDYNFKQTFDIKANPKLPSFGDINRYITLNASYGSSYAWQNNFTQLELGKSAGYNSKLSANLTIRLKSIFAPWFQEEKTEQTKQQLPIQKPTEGGRGGRRSQRGAVQQPAKPIIPEENIQVKDSLALSDSIVVNDSLAVTDSNLIEEEEVDDGPSKLEIGLEFLKLAFKWIFLDYDQIGINFSQSSSYTGGGLTGRTGFHNFWGANHSDSKGPSRLFMLGLSNDIGPRAPNGNLQDNYTHKNDLDFKTSRPLWEGAQLDINWRVGWGINKASTIQTNEEGEVTVTNLVSTGTIDRSFLALPSSGIFSFLGGGIKKVHENYNPNDANPAKNLSEAFLKGFETAGLTTSIPFLSDVLKYIPRPNWSFNWSGLEKYSLFSFAKRVSLQHSYTSTYSEGWKINTDGIQEIQSQRVDFGFSPLAGVTMQFDKVFGGSFSSTVRFSTKESYSLGATTRNITKSLNNDINITASYSKSGFELPLFGVSLKNDLEISFTYTSGKSSSIIYKMNEFKEEGEPQEGKTNTTIEPKIKYVMSSRVTLSIFYKRTSIEPEGASRIPPTVTNEAGIDVHIAIQ
ncbi:MAG: cell surface protein SprA [Bacteroidota bacterium]